MAQAQGTTLLYLLRSYSVQYMASYKRKVGLGASKK